MVKDCYIVHIYSGHSYVGIAGGGDFAFDSRDTAQQWIDMQPHDWQRFEIGRIQIYDEKGLDTFF